MQLESFGSYETCFQEDDPNAKPWPIPNVLGARPRSLSTRRQPLAQPKMDRQLVRGKRMDNYQSLREEAKAIPTCPFGQSLFHHPAPTPFLSFRRSHLILVARFVHSFFVSWRKS
jgi:hypothetical protein